MPAAEWAEARAQMLLDPTVVNLNTGSFGPLPRVVFERVTELRGHLAHEPMDFLLRAAPPLLCAARERLATFLSGDPRRLCFMANVTSAINTVASSLRLAAPGEVLLTDHEYGAMHWCWQRAAQRQRLTLRTFPLPTMAADPGEIVAAFRAALSARTRLLFFSHVLSPTGLVLPVQEICAEARRRGVLTVIDGAHAAAMVPVDLRTIGCDYYGGNCHKWLLAPTGSGFLYFGEGAAERLQPLQVSWGWHYDPTRADERDEFGSTPRVRSFEFEGTRDPCPWISVAAALAFQAGLGWERIRARMEELVCHTRRELAERVGLNLATPPQAGLHGSMTAFRLPVSCEARALRETLWRHRIEAPVIERPDGSLLRVSTHFYNTEDEVTRLADVLKESL